MGSSFSLTALSDMFADFAKQLNKFFQYLKNFFTAVSERGIDAAYPQTY